MSDTLSDAELDMLLREGAMMLSSPFVLTLAKLTRAYRRLRNDAQPPTPPAPPQPPKEKPKP